MHKSFQYEFLGCSKFVVGKIEDNVYGEKSKMTTPMSSKKSKCVCFLFISLFLCIDQLKQYICVAELGQKTAEAL